MKSTAITTSILSALLVLQTSSALAVMREPDSRQITEREEEPVVGLLSVNGKPSIRDVVWYKWASSWFISVAGAIVHRNRDDITALYKDIGVGEGTDNKPTDEAEFTLTNAQGGKFKHEVMWMDVSGDADYDHATWVWWLAGLEATAMKMGGYAGLEPDEITDGSPTDAFQMLMGKEAKMTTVHEGEALYHLLKENNDKPCVFKVADNVDDGYGFYGGGWYPVIDLDDSSAPNADQSQWEAAKLKYHAYKTKEENDIGPQYLSDVVSQLTKVVCLL